MRIIPESATMHSPVTPSAMRVVKAYEIDGHRYLYIESSGSGWNIGDIPEDYQTTQAEFYLIP